MLDTERVFIEEYVEPALRNGHGYLLWYSLLKDANNDGDQAKRRALLDAYGRATGTPLWECQGCGFCSTKAQ
jgi:hypothetical protein